MQRIYDGANDESRFSDDQNTKKVRFKKGSSKVAAVLVVDLDLTPTLSWKDKLLEGGSAISGKASDRSNGESKGDLNCWKEILSQPYSSVVMAWIRLPGLPGLMYKKKILEAIRGVIGRANGPWIMVERKSWHRQRNSREKDQVKSGNNCEGSRFIMLSAAGKIKGAGRRMNEGLETHLGPDRFGLG
ncbi:hypothetical protein GOBAR_AA23917 [Gossypium barbadense]|uniref:DUF4283 domain-containing protein n=1 Tax=Gossypium barbadense TaxID=3634 RepID=A0A2P5X080_GOSBA|nr:hypothetical protein GOBAR_AA23917 [Gossypium barbadense]